MTVLTLPSRPRILVIRRDNIGDLVCTTPAIAALRKHYPNAEIAALVNSYNAEVLRGNPNLDQVFVYQKLKHAGGIASRIKAVVNRLRLIARLRRWKADVTILAKASYERHGLKFAQLIGAKNIIGYIPTHPGQASVMPDVRLEPREYSALHEVQAVSVLLQPLGITGSSGSLRVYPDLQEVNQRQQSLPDAEKRIALHISAREPERRWGTDNYIALARHIIETHPEFQIMLFWSPGKSDDPRHPGDDEAAKRLIRALQCDRVVPVPTKNLTELIAALSLCDIFIGTDGGAMHLAAALDKRILALFENRPDKLNHWYPWRVKSRVVHGAAPEITSISREAVFAALAALTQERP